LKTTKVTGTAVAMQNMGQKYVKRIGDKGRSIKDVRSQGGFQYDIFRTRGWGSSDADVRIFWCKRLRIFRNLWCVRTDKRGEEVEPVQTFSGQEGSIFCVFMRTSFMD